MSAFLGPIHFWLYNKIQFQENLIDELVAYVTAKGWSDKVDQYVSTATATAITLCVRPWSTDSCRLRTMP